MSESYSVFQVKSLLASAVQCSNDFDKENEPSRRYETIGGVLLDTKYIWTANGPRFTVTNAKTGWKVAAWSFGSVFKDSRTKVVCVDELRGPTGNLPLLVIGLECDVTGGMICIFDVMGSRVVRAIQTDEKVTSLHVIDARNDKCPLPGPLRAFDGILSVGTAGGNVLLLDICRQICDEVLSGSGLNDIRDEVNSCLVKTLFLDNIHSLELHKQVAIKNGEHLAIHLNDTTGNNVTPHFILKGPKGDDRVHVNKIEVVVSALHYCPQLGSVLIGYNFGAWQLWDLINLRLVYTSPIYEENVPVTQFAIQEPCDDPRAFCYVWAVYSNTGPHQRGFPVAVLYSLNYSSKEWHEGYGILYLDLTSCAVRFQTDLTQLDERQTDDCNQGAYCLRLQAINKSISKGGALQDHHEETLALCSVVWTAWNTVKSNRVSQTYMSLFDLNQWYKAQMPSSPRLKECDTYMTHVCLSKLLPTVGTDQMPILDVRININTLSQFFGSQKLEEHYYPSSLAFQLSALREPDVVVFNNQGRQRALLSNLESGGPLSLIKPTQFFQQSITLGLLPLFFDVPSNTTLSLECQRELLLSISLEQQLLGWLCRCASAWSNGSHSVAGCTLHFLLSWGWQRAYVLKQNADKLSTSLFDYSGLRLDSNTHGLLSNCARQLNNLATLFGYISKNFSQCMLDPDIVRQQWESLQMVSVHLEVLQWLLNVGLLPECPLSSYPRADEFNRISAPYPVDSLINYYNERRTHLQSLNQEQFSTSGSLLFIDNLIELECGGHKLQDQWKTDDGNGLYPPPSLQGLLRTYLMEDVEISFKHCVIVYVFLDLAMTLNQSRYKPIITHLIKFPAVFQVSPSIIKITQAFWQLDHGDFATAMEQLLDPLVCSKDLKAWHHRVALKALLTQEQYNFALLYLQVRQPPVTEVQDMCTVLSLFVANNMLDEAFHFQRQNKSEKNEEQLLRYFYHECDRLDSISSILNLPLTNTEEKVFMEYLKDVNHPKMQEWKIFYLIQRSRYMDAFRLNDECNKIKVDNKGLRGQENVGFRDLIIKEYAKTLPGVSKLLMKHCQEEKQTLWKKVTKPEPLSVFVHNTREQAKYKSTLINAVLSKAKETWTHPILNNSVKDGNINFSANITMEDTPFLNTPKAIPFQSRMATPVIFPKITNLEELGEGVDGPSPAKRFKPSPRLSVTSPENQPTIHMKSINMDVTCTALCVKLDTPIIKRKASKRSTSLELSDEKFSVGTPQSILKVYNLVRGSQSPDSGRAKTPEDLNMITKNTNESSSSNYDVTVTRSVSLLPRRITGLGLTPRKPLSRTLRPNVRFEVSRASSESSVTSNTSEPSYEIICDQALVHSSIDGIQSMVSKSKTASIQQSVLEGNSKNSSVSTEEVFYSPDASINSNTESKRISELESITETDESKMLNQQVPKEFIGMKVSDQNKSSIDSESPRSRGSYKRRMGDAGVTKDQDVNLILDVSELHKSEIVQTPSASPKTPRSRRSYKESLPEVGVRSSPRFRKSLFQNESPTPTVERKYHTRQSQSKEAAESEMEATSQSTKETVLQSPLKVESPIKSKLQGRRSLSRLVLEANTFSKLTGTPTRQIKSSPGLLPSSNTSELEDTFNTSSCSTISFSYNSIDIAHIADGERLSTSSVTVEEVSVKLGDDLVVPFVDDNLPEKGDVLSTEVETFKNKDIITAVICEDQEILDFEPESASERETDEEQNKSETDEEENKSETDEEENKSETDEEENKCDTNEEENNSEADEVLENKGETHETESENNYESDTDTVLVEVDDGVANTGNVYDDLSSDNYGSADPQMNVFEGYDYLNNAMCVGKNEEVIEMDTNYTTSTNDDEVFADKSDVLSNVVAVNEGNFGQFETVETEEVENPIEDVDDTVTNYHDCKKDNRRNFSDPGNAEIIELESSSDEEQRDRDTEDSSNQSYSSSQSDNSERENEERNLEKRVPQESSSSESSSREEHSVLNSDEDADAVKKYEGRSKEILSPSESSSESNKTTTDVSGSQDEGVSELSNDHMSNSSEDNSKVEESADSAASYEQADIQAAKSTAIETNETDHIQFAIISEEKSTEPTQLENVTEVASEQMTEAGEFRAVPEEISETIIENPLDTNFCLSTIVEEVSETTEVTDASENSNDTMAAPKELSTDENNKSGSSKTSTDVEPSEPPRSDKKSSDVIKDVSLAQQKPCNENSASIEQVTGVEVPPTKNQMVSTAEKEPNTNSLNATDIVLVHKTQDTKSKAKTTNKNHVGSFASKKSIDWLNQTDILDVSNVPELSINSVAHASALQTDILDESENFSRKSLNIFNQTDIVDRSENRFSMGCDLFEDVLEENTKKTSTPARRSRRISSLQSTPSELPQRRTRRSISCTDSAPKEDVVTSDSKLPTSGKLEDPPVAEELAETSRKRAIKPDVKEMPTKRRTLRSSSSDIEIKTKKNENKGTHNLRTRRAASVTVDLPIVKELKSDKVEIMSSKSERGSKGEQSSKPPRKSKSTVTAVASKSTLEEYSTARRLTRRQASLLKKSFTTSPKTNMEQLQESSDIDSDGSESPDRGPDFVKIDPIKLLEKQDFEGKSDSDEEKAIQRSSPSSVAESPIGSQATRTLRSRSSMSNASPRSEASTPRSISEAGPSRKQKVQSAKRTIIGPSPRRNQRSKSTDDGLTQTTSLDESSPPKLRKIGRGSKKAGSSSAVVVTKKTLSMRKTRSASLAAEQAELEESPVRRSERRSLLSKSELPQIIEEQTAEAVDVESRSAVAKTAKRNLRNTKSKK